MNSKVVRNDNSKIHETIDQGYKVPGMQILCQDQDTPQILDADDPLEQKLSLCSLQL